ncbi:MAG: hypothetical protein J6P16_02180 [Eubacterium sp.]|nr:hypothetical protein [Eubacterium sp.]
MKKLLKKMNTGREGATLITVVIATAFMVAIGVIILAASTRYLVSVYMDRNSNDNLYDAEGVLAEVRAGVLEYAGNSGAEAYKEIVENYGTVFTMPDGSPISMRDRFAQLYISGIIMQLEGGSVSGGITRTWDESKVNDLTQFPSLAVSGGAVQSFSINSLRSLTNHPESVKTKAMLELALAGGEGGEIPAESMDLSYGIYKSASKGYFLTIKNLVIDHTDDAGYRSTIQTDVQLSAPDYKFDGDDTLDAASKFLLISDGRLRVGDGAGISEAIVDPEGLPAMSADGAEFDGSIYTGGRVGTTDSLGEIIGDSSAILVEPNMGAHFNCETLISRGSLEAKTGSHVYIRGAKEITNIGGVPTLTESANGDIYLKNILLTPSSASVIAPAPDTGKGTIFNMKANAYIENDLDIRDAGTTVALGGKYFGYSYSEENGDSETAAKSQSDYSSAILVNGLGTRLLTNVDFTRAADGTMTYLDDVDNLDMLLLAGRTFVKRGTSAQVYNDIMMGESVAVKSNQIAYLVPDKYVSAGHNPVTATEASWDGSSFFNPDSLINMRELRRSGLLWSLLDENHPVVGNYKSAANSESESYVFLYLNFKNQNAANEYFKAFYRGDFISGSSYEEEDEIDEDKPGDATPEDLNTRAKAYIVSDDGGITMSPSLFMIAGNIVRNTDAEGGPGFQSATYFDGDGNPLPLLLNEGKSIGYRYVNLQKYLTTAGDASSMRLVKSAKTFLDRTTSTRSTQPELVKDTMIRVDKIQTIGTVSTTEPQTGAKVYCSQAEGDLELSATYLGTPGADGKGRCLIINNGDVTIPGSGCSGLIIANGDVYVKGDFTGLIIETGNIDVQTRSKLESDQVLVDKLLNYARSDEKLSGVFGLTEPETHNATIAEDCCQYLNWEKNSY